MLLVIGVCRCAPPPGDITIAEIHRYRADVALLSPAGDAECGATKASILREAEGARAMAANAKQRILLADFSKIGPCSRVVVLRGEPHRSPDRQRQRGKDARTLRR